MFFSSQVSYPRENFIPITLLLFGNDKNKNENEKDGNTNLLEREVHVFTL